MTYATHADLAARFGADEIDADLGAADGSQRAASALADADAEIDAMLAATYDLPLPSGAYPLLRAAACDIARLRLYDDAAPEEAVVVRARRARDRVRAVAEGRGALVSMGGAIVARRRVEAGPALGARTNLDSDSPLATRERMKGL